MWALWSLLRPQKSILSVTIVFHLNCAPIPSEPEWGGSSTKTRLLSPVRGSTPTVRPTPSTNAPCAKVCCRTLRADNRTFQSKNSPSRFTSIRGLSAHTTRSRIRLVVASTVLTSPGLSPINVAPRTLHFGVRKRKPGFPNVRFVSAPFATMLLIHRFHLNGIAPGFVHGATGLASCEFSPLVSS